MLANSVVKLSTDSLNPELNFKVAVEYEKLGQYAAAMSFYLRSAEYGWIKENELAYTALLKIALCAESMQDRKATALNSLLQAVNIASWRPEAYFLLSQYYERVGDWQQCYTWANLGHSLEPFTMKDLPAEVGYLGTDSLVFQLALSYWWLGDKDQSRSLFESLQYSSLPEQYLRVVEHNLAYMDELN